MGSDGSRIGRLNGGALFEDADAARDSRLVASILD